VRQSKLISYVYVILIKNVYTDTYEGAQSHLENAINGEVVVSTDLENRGKGGRLKKKFKLAVAKAVIEPSHTSKGCRQQAVNVTEEHPDMQQQESIDETFTNDETVVPELPILLCDMPTLGSKQGSGYKLFFKLVFFK